MTGYTRQRDAETGPGLLIRASDLDAEFNQVQAAFNNSTGHTHTGAAGEGGRITEMGPTGELIVDSSSAYPKTNATYNLGSSTFKWNKLFIADQILPNGKTAAAPAYAFINDTDTGMFNGGANILSFATGGATRFTVNTADLTSTVPFVGTNVTLSGDVNAVNANLTGSLMWSSSPFSGLTGNSTSVSVFGANSTYIGANGVTGLEVTATYTRADLPIYCNTFGALGYGSAGSPTVRFGPIGTGVGVYGTASEVRVSNGSADTARFSDTGLKVSTSLHDVYHEGNILSAVGISGGVPTGGIIETGTNADGRYVKFADGTMICQHEFDYTDIITAAGALFRSADKIWTFPATFAAAPVTLSGNLSTADSWIIAGSVTTTSANVRAISYASKAGVFGAKVFAIGRWTV